MLEALLCAWREARILSDDEQLLVIDKPSGIPVHGGDEAARDDVVSRLGAWLSAAGRDPYLGVHQRLDKGTSGVLAFTRAAALNQSFARDVEAHALDRLYVAAVELTPRCHLPDAGRLEHRLEHRPGDRTRVVQQGGQRAIVEYRVLSRNGPRALVELRPKTGRTHQLRVQLANVGAPIAGDGLYGGKPAARLMLHAKALGLPHLDRRFEAPVPAEFDAWFRTGELRLGDRDTVEGRLRDAGMKRYALRECATAFRLVNDSGDLLPGVTVDLYGEHAALSVSSEEALARAEDLAECLVRAGVAGVYLKIRVRSDLRRRDAGELAPRAPLVGSAAPERLQVQERDARFWVWPSEGLSSGLFVDQRDNRQRVRALAAGQRVLNLFAYTCSFSVVAALGGAQSTLSIDLSGRALARGRENFELNGLAGAHRFLKEDVLGWLARAARRSERFDLVVLDPPSFATVGKERTFSVERGYPKLVEDTVRLLAPGGKLLAVTNHRKTSQQTLRKLVRRAALAAGRRVQSLKDLPSTLDCPAGEAGPEPSKSVLLTVE